MYSIDALDGTKAGVSADYPWNQIKNAPSGTRVNDKMLGDMLQMFAKMMNVTGITPNDLPDNVTNGYQLVRAQQLFLNYALDKLIKGVRGPDALLANQVYVISGCETRFDDGIAYYNGEIYYVLGNPNPACGGGFVDILRIAPDTTLPLSIILNDCGASGGGIADFANINYMNPIVISGGTLTTLTVHFGRPTVYKYNSGAAAITIVPSLAGAAYQTEVIIHVATSTPGDTIGIVSGSPAAVVVTGASSLIATTSNGWIIKLKYSGDDTSVFNTTFIEVYNPA